MKRFVYLAGPILGCTFGEANDWRAYVSGLLLPHGIVGISPLRCEPIHGERYTEAYQDPRFGTARAIAAKNKFDVQTCDMTLAYLPETDPHRASYGTIGEIFWADADDKRVILVTTDQKLLVHPVIDAAVDWKLSTLEEAVDVLVGVLGGYVGGKNV